MKNIFLSLCFLVILSAGSFAGVIRPGEKIHYKIVQLGLSTGEASLTYLGSRMYHKQKTVLIIFQAKGFKFFDEERIFVDPKTMFPLFVERNLNIFGNRERITEEYSKDHVKITKGKNQQVIEKDGDIDNIYAFIYRYRQMGQFHINDSFVLHLPTKDVPIKLIRKDTLDVALKRYKVFYMESNPANYRIWFDTSEKKIPLRISGAIKMAHTVMVMTQYDR